VEHGRQGAPRLLRWACHPEAPAHAEVKMASKDKGGRETKKPKKDAKPKGAPVISSVTPKPPAPTS